MRVLHVITSGEHGGAQAHVAEVVRQLQGAGVECGVACGPGDWLAETLAGRAAVTEIPTLRRSISPWSDLMSLWRLVRLARTYDVVHTHSAKAGFLGRLAALLAGRPFVHTSHGSYLGEPMSPIRRMVLRAAERVVSSRTAHLFVLSRADLDLWRRAGLYATVPATTIRVATERMRHPAGSWVPTTGSSLIVAVANLYPNKAIDILIEAFAEVRQAVPGASLTIAGDGPERARLTAQAERTASRDICFAGRIADPSSLILSGSVFVLSSRKEGVPLALLEALALGAPSVATSVGGVPEHVRSDEAVLVPPEHAAVARALIDILREPERAAELGRRGRAAAERYLLESAIDPIVAAYQQAIDGGVGPYNRTL